MSNAQAERAISLLYESDSLRSELRDEEASLLLMWGEARLNELAKHDLPDDQFDHLSAQFRSLLAAINVCVGKRKTSPSQHLPMMANISSAAEASGYTFTPDDQTTFLKQQGALTNQDAISELLGLLKPAAIPRLPSPNIAEAVAEIVTLPPSPPSQSIGEALPEIITPQSVPEMIDTILPPPPEALPEPLLSQSIGEAMPEIITPVPPPVDNTLPPQPEDLPELPPHSPPQEG